MVDQILDPPSEDANKEAPLETANGLDARFDARFKQRIETLKRAVRPVMVLPLARRKGRRLLMLSYVQ
jgi:hypothetical protein